jgi:ParB-like nuclease domain
MHTLPHVENVDELEIPGRSPLPAERQEQVRNRIHLVDIRSLRLYEIPNSERVAEIEESFRRSGVLEHPVIVDPRLDLLIDGHHRVQALERLGLTHIPAFTVDYESDEVQVKGWSRATDADPEEVRRAFQMPGGEVGGGWAVLAKDPQEDLVARREFTDPQEGALYLDAVSEGLYADGHMVRFSTPADASRFGLVHSYIEPVVGKAEVIQVIDSGEVFPHEVNRHLVRNRPLGLHTPLDTTTSPRRFQTHLESRFHRDPAPVIVEPGLRQGERLYEEQVTLLSARGVRAE